MSNATFEAATVEEALEAAATGIGAAAADLDYEIVEKKEDFWGMGEGTVVIKAWRRAEPEPEAAADVSEAIASVESAEATAEAAPPHAAPAQEAEPEGAETPEEEPEAAVPTEEPDEAAPERAAKEEPRDTDDTTEGVESSDVGALLEQIFHDMEFECTVEVEAEDEGFLATIDGADKDAILEGNGRCLSALELLVNNAFRHKLPRGSKIRVDAGDFRNRRDEELSDLAFQVAHSAKQSGRTQETQPLNPYERRLVHLALAEDPAVTTRSRGSGFLKNVQVIPSNQGRDRSRGRRG